MKKVLYNYLCLLVALCQTFVWFFTFVCLIWALGDSSVWGVVIGGVVVVALITAFVDAPIRGFFKKPLMIAFDFAVSPARAVLQIITIVKMHKEGTETKYAKRKKFGSIDDFCASYVLFNNEEKKPYSSAAPKPKRNAKQPAFTLEQFQKSFASRQQKRMDEVRPLLGGVEKPSVVFVPIIRVNGKVWEFTDYHNYFSYYDEDRSYRSKRTYAKITGLDINGVNMLDMGPKVSPLSSVTSCALYLKPGSYAITIDYNVLANGNEIVETSACVCKASGEERVTLNVIDGSAPIYVAFFVDLKYSWTRSFDRKNNPYCSKITWTKQTSFEKVAKSYFSDFEFLDIHTWHVKEDSYKSLNPEAK